MDLQAKLKAMSAQERRTRLLALAEKEEEKTVSVPVDREESAELEHQISETTTQILDKEEQKKEVLKTFKEEIKELKEVQVDLIETRRTGLRKQLTTVYTIANEDSNQIEEYDPFGNLISARPMPRNQQRSVNWAVNQ